MGIKILNRDPKSTEFSRNDIVINVKEGSVFYKANNGVFKIQGDNIGQPSEASVATVSASYAISSSYADAAVSASYAISSSYAVSASFAISASHEITTEVSSSYAETASFINGLSGTNSGDVTLSGTPDYITISNQVITRNQIDLANDVTGVLPSANLDADTAHLTTTQTFTGQKSFSTPITASIISASSFISASHFSGDGSGLSNLPSATHDGNFGTTAITASNFTASNAETSVVSAATGSFRQLKGNKAGDIEISATNVLPPANDTVNFGSIFKMFKAGYFLSGFFGSNTIQLVSQSLDDSGDVTTADSSSFSKDDLDNLKNGKAIISTDNQLSLAARGQAESEDNSVNYIRPTLIMHPTDNESALIHKTAHRLHFRCAGGDPFEIFCDGGSNDLVRLGSTTTNATEIKLHGVVSASINGGSF